MGDDDAIKMAAKQGVRLEFFDLPEGVEWGAMAGIALCRRASNLEFVECAISEALRLSFCRSGRPV